MATVYVETRGYFDCDTCGKESQTDPMPSNGKTVVCEHCGATYRVKASGFMVVDWIKRNRDAAKAAIAKRA